GRPSTSNRSNQKSRGQLHPSHKESPAWIALRLLHLMHWLRALLDRPCPAGYFDSPTPHAVPGLKNPPALQSPAGASSDHHGLPQRQHASFPDLPSSSRPLRQHQPPARVIPAPHSSYPRSNLKNAWHHEKWLPSTPSAQQRWLDPRS